ncbi:hypothetical protein P1P68_17640 [Streptomyces scabiei]|uniref:hypothetical protein n=1 Tax=Streptomyces scabiei TaxID=1930 RepID=UPI0029902321|nr:hypothetical protein [Streptomyces scabiei]MDW8806561.1 hypothetical protein [Streptomyces scabiei]
MPVSVLATIALSVLLGLLVIILHWADSHGPDSTAADPKTTNTQAAAGAKHIDVPQARWNIHRGSGS